MATIQEALRLLEWSHVGLRMCVVVYSWILFVWCTLDLVPNFSNSLFHISFWLGLEILYVPMCMLSTGYGVFALRGKILVDTDRNIKMALFCMVLTFLIGGKNITQIMFVALELADRSSPLAVNNYWFLVVFLILLIILLLINIGTMLQFHWYRKHLRVFREALQSRKKQ